jgi:hypothetical protein
MIVSKKRSMKRALEKGGVPIEDERVTESHCGKELQLGPALGQILGGHQKMASLDDGLSRTAFDRIRPQVQGAADRARRPVNLGFDLMTGV